MHLATTLAINCNFPAGTLHMDKALMCSVLVGSSYQLIMLWHFCFRLRALSDGNGPNSVTSPPPSPAAIPIPKYKLAEHRYGREEMLALCDMTLNIPESLLNHQAVLVEKAQQPMAYINLSEEEQVSL